jgi:hypothetical protein
MGELLLNVIPLGIGAAFTPSLFAVQLLIVANDPWKVRALAAFLGAASAFGIAVTLLLLGFAKLHTSTGGPDELDGLLRLLASAVLGAFTIYFFLPHPGLEKRVATDIENRVAKALPIEFFGITFLLSIKDLSSFVLLVPAMHDIGVADISWPLKLGVTALVFILALSPLLAPPLMRSALGSRGKASINRLYTFTMNHQLTIMGVIFSLFTFYLLISGLNAL